MAEHQTLGGKHFLIFGPEIRRIWWLKKVQYLQKKGPLPLDLPAWKKTQVDVSQSWQSIPASRERVVPTEWQVRTIIGDCKSKAEVITVHTPQYRLHAWISDFLDLANLSVQEEAALATNWIDDRPEGLKLQNLALATMAGPVMSSSPINLTADVQHAINKCESSGPAQQLILHGNSSAIAATFSHHMAILRRFFFYRICISSAACCFRASSVAILTSLQPAVNLLPGCSSGKPVQRPFGVRVCPVAQLDFFSPAFDPRAWTTVVFWKEDSGRQLPLVTPENEGGDETSSPSPPKFHLL